MNVEKYIREEFQKTEVRCQSIDVTHPFDEVNFGNWCALVSCDLGRLRITNDRGQIFIENFDEHLQRFIWGQENYPSLLLVYKHTSKWQLSDLLKTMVSET